MRPRRSRDDSEPAKAVVVRAAVTGLTPAIFRVDVTL